MNTRPGHPGHGYHNNNNVLWMGDVDADMDESFLVRSFADLNEPVEYVRVLPPKEGCVSGYAFVGFRDEANAQRVLNSLNGKLIPNTQGKRFKLNSSIRNHQAGNWPRHGNNNNQAPKSGPRNVPSPGWQARSGQRTRQAEFTAYVGDLTVEMEDDSFFQLFKNSYPSVFEARIMRLPDGSSKHFAFVRFEDEAEYREALTHEARISMQLGCQIRISKAHPRPPNPRRYSGRVDTQDPSCKFQTAQSLPEPAPQLRARQSSPSGQPLPQPFMTEPMPPLYYIPVPYPTFADPAFWPAHWQDFYSHVPLQEGPHASQPAFGQQAGSVLPEAGDTINMQPYPVVGRPTAWPMHLPLPHQHPAHFLPDPRFLYTSTADVGDVVDGAKICPPPKAEHLSD